MRKLVLLVIATWGLLLFAADSKSSNANPWVGSWKLDTAKSKFHAPAPKQETVDVEAADKSAIKYKIDGTDAKGQAYSQSFDGKPDGKEYPIMFNGQEAGKISYKWQSKDVAAGEGVNADGSTSTSRVSLSRNKKNLTVKMHTKGKDGEYNETAVYTK